MHASGHRLRNCAVQLSIDAGHAEIGDDDVDAPFLEPCQRAIGVERDVRGESVRVEEEGQGVSYCWIVIDDQHAGVVGDGVGAGAGMVGRRARS